MPARALVTIAMLLSTAVLRARTRPARITYIDSGARGGALVRNALLFEDDVDAMARVEGTADAGFRPGRHGRRPSPVVQDGVHVGVRSVGSKTETAAVRMSIALGVNWRANILMPCIVRSRTRGSPSP